MSMPSSHQNNDNFTPIIGILCIDIAVDLQQTFGNDYYSYISASYVKYLESAGARIIAIWINRPRSYYEAVMSKINGILFPGGAVYFVRGFCTDGIRNECVQSSKYIFEIAKDLNKKGQHFPLWGTCMGFQLMLTHSADREEIRQDCEPMYCSLPVKFESDEVLASSKLFGHIDEDLKTKMSSLKFGIHLHKYCITKDDLQTFQIDQHWTVLACNKDERGLEFITIIEHNKYPFYGLQIHPERVGFNNYMSKHTFHHCLECFELAHYFAKFFVQECSLNRNRFINVEEESRYSIYNFPVFLHVAKDVFRQCYLFKEDVDYPTELNPSKKQKRESVPANQFVEAVRF